MGFFIKWFLFKRIMAGPGSAFGKFLRFCFWESLLCGNGRDRSDDCGGYRCDHRDDCDTGIGFAPDLTDMCCHDDPADYDNDWSVMSNDNSWDDGDIYDDFD